MSSFEEHVRSDNFLPGKSTAATSSNAWPSLGRGPTNWPVWRPLAAVLLLSVLIRIFEVDQNISRLCYDFEGHRWPFDTAHPWLWFYRNGPLPPLLIGLGGGALFLWSLLFRKPVDPARSDRLRRVGLFLCLLLLIGPGLLVNSSLKMMWGRPRPWQCEQFGGDMTFVPVGELGTLSLPNSSFPSGHAAVAFFLMGLGFIIPPSRRRLQRTFFYGGMAYGLAMGLTRVLQGGHFPSDVLWAGAIVYFVAVGLARLILKEEIIG